MIGKVIDKYEVKKKIGSGGMGEVYLAQDTTLKRDVALKFLPDLSLGNHEQLARFLREAQAAAALNHPNIFTIHEINETPNGQKFIVMDYYPGRNLMEHLANGPVSEEVALEIAWGIAEGLGYAHAAGIIHRDIKPTNIMVSDDCQIKILDFGLAKMANKSTFTDTKSTLGTAAYMSPEQAGAGPVDHRTDIWSLGAVLFQMLTGNLPFPGDFPDAIVYGILHRDPFPLPTGCCSKNLHAILKKMLTKAPDERYQDMTEVLHDLGPLVGKTSPTPIRQKSSKKISFRAILMPALLVLAIGTVYLAERTQQKHEPSRKSVAALPFENLTGDDRYSIWTTGIPQLLLAELSRSPELYVLNQQASTTVYEAMGSPATAGLSLPLMQDFAQRTQVETLILGSIMKAGNQWRIQVHLQDPKTGNLLTSALAEINSEDKFFAAADSLADIIRNFLEIKELEEDLSYGYRKYAAGTESAAAYRQFLEAYESYRKREWGQAKAGFEKALEYDPDYTGVQFMLVWTYRQLGLTEQTQEMFDLVQAQKSSLPVTDQYSLDCMEAILDKDHWQAIQSLKKVVDRDPQLRGKWGQLGALYLSVEEPKLARAALEEAIELTQKWGDKYPWVHLYRNLAQVYVDLGLYDEAIESARMGLDTGEQNRRSMLFWLCVANIAKGDHAEAQHQLDLFSQELRSKGIGDVIIRMNVGFIYLKAGCTAQALPQMREGVASDPAFFPAVSWLATMLADAGQPQEAVDTLQNYLNQFPDHDQAKVDIAKIQITNDQSLAEAVTSLEQLRLADPQLVDSPFLRSLGQGYLKQGQTQLAVAALEESWDLLKQYDHETLTRLEEARAALLIQ